MDIVQRGVCRTQLTKLCNSITEFLTNGKVESEQEMEQELQVFIRRLQNAHENLKRADEKVRDTIREEDFQRECESVLEYDDRAVSLLAKLEHKLTTCERNKHETSRVADQGNLEIIAGNPFHGVRLKPLDLKKFDGNFEGWLPFWEQFKQAVHENHQLSMAAKFNYLTSALVGKAATILEGFTPSERCYNDVIRLLLEEYGNTNKIVENYLQKLMNIKPVLNARDVKGLRELYNEVCATVRSLAALQVQSSQYEIMVTSILLRAIPLQMRIQFHRIKNNGPLSSSMLITLDEAAHEHEDNGVRDEPLKGLLELIKSEIEALEKSNMYERKLNSNYNHYEREKKQRADIATATGLLTETQRSISSSHCVFCGKMSHTTKDCRGSLSIEQKKSVLRREGRCFRCANPNHSSKFCKAQWIKCAECGGRHITTMCERKRTANSERTKEQTRSEKSSDNNAEAAASTSHTTSLNTTVKISDSEIYLQTAHAIISDTKQVNNVCSRIIMDNGSQNTYISDRLYKELSLRTIKFDNLKIYGFGENEDKRARKYKRVKLTLKSQYCEKTICISAIVVPDICVNLVPTVKPADKTLAQLRGRLADGAHCCKILISGINILIGQDNYWKFNSFESKRLAENLVAVNTFFGWTIQGKIGDDDQSVNENFALYSLAETEYSFDVTNFWKLEAIGITNTQADSEQDIWQNITSNIEWRDNRYSVKLPWRRMVEKLNDNKRIALTRLKGLAAKLLRADNKLIEYDSEIRDLNRNGIAEEVIQEANGSLQYYMPHRPVYREEKITTKMRIVFDASSSESGCTSLNEHLSAGANLTADILATLLRFRSNKFAIIADIKQAFLQISLDESDRDAHRFLWFETIPKPNEELPNIKCFRMTRVTFGVTSSPFLLAATIREHLRRCKSKYGEICDKLQASFYVDDLIMSEESLEAAKEVCQKAQEIMSGAKFILRKWNSNSSELRKIFPKDEVERPAIAKVLGVKWCTITDTIGVDIDEIINYIQSLRATKRNVLKAMAKIYDPLGLLGPFTMRVKLLLQCLWKMRVDWDQNIANDMLSEFQSWQEELVFVTSFSVQRCGASLMMNSTNEIHVFSDASPKAYGVVAYVRRSFPNGVVTTNLLCSKNRVAPIKKNQESELTIPKLELTAALIAARLSVFIKNSIEIEIQAVHLWTDSVIALSWIMGQSKKIKPYVTTRVTEINKLTNIYQWKHCEGKTNPADLLTRGLSGKALLESKLWAFGPTWLMENQDSWPKVFSVGEGINMLIEQADVNQVYVEEPVCRMEDFSTRKRLLRVTAFILRFIKNLHTNQRNEKPCSLEFVPELTAMEIKTADLYWIKYVQNLHYNNEMSQLKKHLNISRSSKILSLNPMMVDGVLRLNSRLAASEFGNVFANPIILPKNSHFSILLIREVHLDTHHGGVSMVLTQIRKKFWIVQGRQLIKRILQACVICKRLYGKSASEDWTVLPLERVRTSRPFETTGVDFAGPLYVKNEIGGSDRKVYLMLFTCAAIRAIHLELVEDLTAKSCKNALKRFVARRGLPKTIISDNAKTFKRVDLELRRLEEILKRSDVQQSMAYQGISWKYIPERAAWWGGFWERLVRSVKNSLKFAIGKARLNYGELNTLLVEIEGVINQRPLTYVSNEANGFESLTPAHFLTGVQCSLLEANFNNDGSKIASSWNQRQIILKRYIKRWREEYLSQLRLIHQNKPKPTRSVQIGEVVLVHEDHKNRLFWKMGVIQNVYPGRDGQVRACDVRLNSQQVLRRPIQLLYPLEIFRANPGAEGVKNS